MIKNVKKSVEHLHSLKTRAKLRRYFNEKRVVVVRNSNGRLSMGNKAKDAHFHCGAINAVVYCMNQIINAMQIVDFHLPIDVLLMREISSLRRELA
jgi:hypothetical protein